MSIVLLRYNKGYNYCNDNLLFPKCIECALLFISYRPISPFAVRTKLPTFSFNL